MHSFIFNLLSLVKKALRRDFSKSLVRVRCRTYELKKTSLPSGQARGHQMSTKGQWLVQTGTNWADIQTSTPVFLLSTQRRRQTLLLPLLKHDILYSLRFGENKQIRLLIAETAVQEG